MYKKSLIVFLFLVFRLFSVSGQDNYLYSYLKGEIRGEEQVLTKPFGTGSITVFAYGDKYYHKTLGIMLHDEYGKLVGFKKVSTVAIVDPIHLLVVGERAYVIGQTGSSGTGNPANGGFFMILDKEGSPISFLGFNLKNASVDYISDLVFSEKNQKFLALGFHSEPSPGGGYANVYQFDLNGNLERFKQLHRSGTYASMTALDDGTYTIHRGECNRIMLNADLSVKKIDRVVLRRYEYIDFTTPLSRDSVLILSSNPIGTGEHSYGVYLWNPQNDTFKGLVEFQNLALPPDIIGDKILVRTQFPTYNYYLFDRKFKLLNSIAFPISNNCFGGTLVCDNELLAIYEKDTNEIFVAKTSNWKLPVSGIAATAVTTMDSVGFISPDHSIILDEKEIPFNTNTYNFRVEQLSLDPLIIEADTNCTLFDFDKDSLYLCNQQTALIYPKEYVKKCRPPGVSRNYLWNNGETVVNNAISTTGWFALEIRENGCLQKDSIYIDFDSAQVKVTGDSLFCMEIDQGVRLSASATVPSVFWNSDTIPDTTYFADKQGWYSAKVSTEKGCSTKDSIYVRELCEPLLYIPNSFTPDGDGINDYFCPSILFAEDIEMTVYSRWGEELYKSKGESPCWDGQVKSNGVSSGLYNWSLTFTATQSGERKLMRGTFTIAR